LFGQLTVPLDVPVQSGRKDESPRALPSVWARMKIAELGDEGLSGKDRGLPDQVRQLALDYSLMSSCTAFVAVDSSRRTEGRTEPRWGSPCPSPGA